MGEFHEKRGYTRRVFLEWLDPAEAFLLSDKIHLKPVDKAETDAILKIAQ
jgi:hypothetical protein